jgi:hypothetical protein
MNAKLRKLMSALALPVLLTGCSGTHAVIATDELCRSWRVQSVSKHDKLTQGTAEQIQGNNDARPAWGCHPKENRAKS